jgi:hypothetical protein
MSRKNGVADRWLVPTLVAIGITGVGWAALNLPPKNESWLWLAYFGLLLELPGVGLALFLTVSLPPHNAHNIDAFAWVIVPFNLLSYFLASFFLFRHRSQNASQSKCGQQIL